MINRYWRPLLEGSADATTFMQYLAQHPANVLTTQEIFRDTGLDALHGNYTEASVLGYQDAMRIIFAIAVVILESKKSGAVDVAQLGAPASKRVRIEPTPKELTQITTALKYFALSPEDHAIAEEFSEDALYEVADICEELRARLDV